MLDSTFVSLFANSAITLGDLLICIGAALVLGSTLVSELPDRKKE